MGYAYLYSLRMTRNQLNFKKVQISSTLLKTFRLKVGHLVRIIKEIIFL